MQKVQGPGIFLAQFLGDKKPFSSLPEIVKWVADLGYRGIQIPTWDERCFDLKTAASSQTYCDDVLGICEQAGVAITDLSTHLQGQLIAVHPAYNELFSGFTPAALHGNTEARTEWATQQLHYAAQASARLGLSTHATFSGALLWHTVYPWPQRPPGLVAEGFKELARRWRPILDAFENVGVRVCFELHPGEDLHDGISFERFLAATDNHPAAHILYDPSHFVLQQLDYLAFIDIYHQRIGAFHVKDAEFRPNGRAGVYGGYADWIDRPGRFRSVGDGQVDFPAIFSKLTQYDYSGWAVLEWECCLKHAEQGAREGAQHIQRYIIDIADRAFDDFAGSNSDPIRNRRILGLQE
ncbi:MAG: sugar phosphate isomerase/epimerase [Flavobacteriales bacterium]|jgi:sugar phosphate isomerase/epimerase